MEKSYFNEDLDPIMEAVLEEEDLEEERLFEEINSGDEKLPESMSKEDEEFDRMIEEIESEPILPSPVLTWEDQK